MVEILLFVDGWAGVVVVMLIEWSLSLWLAEIKPLLLGLRSNPTSVLVVSDCVSSSTGVVLDWSGDLKSLSQSDETITLTELQPIANAATSGGKIMVVNGNKAPAANGTERTLYNNDHPKLDLIRWRVCLERAMAVNKSLKSLRTRTMSADSMATSVPAPIAIPTWAWARAGESLIPSPTNKTLRGVARI